ncbi:MAG: endonuclease V [Nitrososphaerales archaeon]
MKVDKATLSLLFKIQEIVAKAHQLEPLGRYKINNVCGVDVSYNKEKTVAVAVLWSCSEKKVIEVARHIGKPFFPYESGYLFMREAPFAISVVRALKENIDLVLVDGHGIAHPRRAGLAVFVGLTLDTPTLGIAKSLLVGRIGPFKDMIAPMILDESIVGVAFKVKEGGKTYYASPGHKLTVEDSMKIIQSNRADFIKALKSAHRSARTLSPKGR